MMNNKEGRKRVISYVTSENKKVAHKRRVMPRTNEESYNLIKPEYYEEGGLRKVRPYYFEYQTYAKQRWLGRSILDVFLKEFRDRPARYYREAIRRKLITMNGQACELESIVEAGALIGHRLHRHEPPVTAQPLRIIHNEKGMMVVDKPASLPAHPSGRYRFNSLVEILKNDYSLEHVSLINRLDRLTSGLCIVGTEARCAEKLHQQMEDGAFRKEYIARVVGQFPLETRCDMPLRVAEHKLGLVTVDEERGKASSTLFERIATNGTESIVRCRPLTGRTHQIRVHLRHLGHPIVNDHLYNHTIWHNSDTKMPTEAELGAIARQLLDETMEREGNAFDQALHPDEDHEEGIICPECLTSRPDPTSDQLCIYLHAQRYSCDDWSFETDLPAWAQDF